MIFKQMKLNNFRQFKGKNTLNFTTDKKKNVTIILGDNGAGKTTLLQAFNWCLYDSIKLDHPTEIINKEALSETAIGKSVSVEVEIELDHLDKTYHCRKFIDYVRNNDGEFRKFEEGQVFTITDSTGETKRTTQNAIREIFPSDLSAYFLFDGERMKELGNNESKGRKDLSRAVKNLMGLDFLESGKIHLEKAKKEFEMEFVSDKSSRLDEINEIIRDLSSKIEEEKNNKAKYEEEKEELEEKLSEVNEYLKNTAALKELQEKRENLNKQLTSTENKIDDKRKDMFTTFSNGSSKFFFGETLVELRNKLKKSNLKDKGIEGINGPAIEHLLKNGRCICGCNLNENLEAKKNLEDLKKYLPPESYATLLKGLEVTMNHTESNNKQFYANFNKMYDEYNKLQNEKDNIINEIRENDKVIDDIGDQDLSEKNNEYKQYRSQISSKDQAIGSCKNMIESYEQTIRARENERSNIVVNNDLNKIVRLKVDICQSLIDKIDKKLKEKELIVRDELQDKTTILLSRMLNSNKKIEIEDDYNFDIMDDYGISSMSEGEKIVTSFAFVGSLISVAKKVIEAEDDSKFTLVMDAPFAKLDLTHRRNVTEEIPKLTDQIILFTSDSQYDDVVRQALHDKVNNSYKITKVSSTLSLIEEGE